MLRKTTWGIFVCGALCATAALAGQRPEGHENSIKLTRMSATQDLSLSATASTGTEHAAKHVRKPSTTTASSPSGDNPTSLGRASHTSRQPSHPESTLWSLICDETESALEATTPSVTTSLTTATKTSLRRPGNLKIPPALVPLVQELSYLGFVIPNVASPTATGTTSRGSNAPAACRDSSRSTDCGNEMIMTPVTISNFAEIISEIRQQSRLEIDHQRPSTVPADHGTSTGQSRSSSTTQKTRPTSRAAHHTGKNSNARQARAITAPTVISGSLVLPSPSLNNAGIITTVLITIPAGPALTESGNSLTLPGPRPTRRPQRSSRSKSSPARSTETGTRSKTNTRTKKTTATTATRSTQTPSRSVSRFVSQSDTPTSQATTPATSTSPAISTKTAEPSSSGSKPLTKGSIAGICVGSAGGALLALAGVAYFLRRRQQASKFKNGQSHGVYGPPPSGQGPPLPVQSDYVTPVAAAAVGHNGNGNGNGTNTRPSYHAYRPSLDHISETGMSEDDPSSRSPPARPQIFQSQSYPNILPPIAAEFIAKREGESSRGSSPQVPQDPAAAIHQRASSSSPEEALAEYSRVARRSNEEAFAQHSRSTSHLPSPSQSMALSPSHASPLRSHPPFRDSRSSESTPSPFADPTARPPSYELASTIASPAIVVGGAAASSDLRHQSVRASIVGGPNGANRQSLRPSTAPSHHGQRDSFGTVVSELEGGGAGGAYTPPRQGWTDRNSVSREVSPESNASASAGNRRRPMDPNLTGTNF